MSRPVTYATKELTPPVPTEVREMRAKYDLTAAEAAELVHAEGNTWYRWESGDRKMDAARWELFLIKLGERKPKRQKR